MHDIKRIREDPEGFDKAMRSRGGPSDSLPASGLVCRADENHRGILKELQELQAERNALSKQNGQMRARGEDTQDLERRAAWVRGRMEEMARAAAMVESRLRGFLLMHPNWPDPEVPKGKDENDNRIEGPPWHPTGGEAVKRPWSKEHWELGARLGMDFERATNLSGARFVVLHGTLARLHRALAQFMLDLHVQEHGYSETNVPLLVREATIHGTGQLTNFKDDLFYAGRFDGESEEEVVNEGVFPPSVALWLIPTAEVPLSALYSGEILDAERLPLRMVAHTPCFRAEAGAAGRDTRGMLRQHQFEKVELVSVVHPDESAAEQMRMRAAAEEVLRRLELPYQVVELCTGDLGFAAARTFDLEVWLPGQGAYREISSVSNCRDFQARRMGARFREKGKKGTRLVHTLNGSGVAVGRALVAVLENHQREDGSVVVPEALRPWMGGAEVLEPQG